MLAKGRFGVEPLNKEQDQAFEPFCMAVMTSSVYLLAMASHFYFAMLPLVYDPLRQHERSSVLVCVTMLLSFMVDQYERFSQVGLRVEATKTTGMR